MAPLMDNPTQSGLHRTLDAFTLAYVTCALWSTYDNADESGGRPLDDNFDESDIADETLQRTIFSDAASFLPRMILACWDNDQHIQNCWITWRLVLWLAVKVSNT